MPRMGSAAEALANGLSPCSLLRIEGKPTEPLENLPTSRFVCCSQYGVYVPYGFIVPSNAELLRVILPFGFFFPPFLYIFKVLLVNLTVG